MRPLPYQGIVATCPATMAYTRQSERGAAWWLGGVLRQLLARAGIAKRDIDGLVAASFTLAPDTSVALAEHFGLEPRFLEWLPTGGASGVMALRRAARAVQCGDAEIVACIAGDTNRPGGFADLVRNFSAFSSSALRPQGGAGPNLPFALITGHKMATDGLAEEDLARIVLTSRANAGGNPNALLGRKPLDMAGYLASPPVAPPLRRDDCVMPCAGGDGFLVMSADRAASLGLRSVQLLGSIERHNAFADDPVAVRGGWAMDADSLWAQAGMGPGDMDALQSYDDYPVISLIQMEDLGFCPKGDGARFLRETPLTVTGGGLVHNSCGGQLGCGQAGAAGGFLGLVEALRQLMGEPLGRQVPNARRMAVSGYGMVNYDRCIASAAAVLAV